MRRIAVSALAVALAILPAPSRSPGRGSARPLLWRIDGAVPSFVFGTIHVPDERVLDLAPAVETALAAADVVVTEIALDEASRQRIASRLLLPEGKTLADVLPHALYERAAGALRERGLSMAPFSRLTPWAFAARLELVDYIARGIPARPLDLVLAERARREGKRTDGLETPEEQLEIFESLRPEEQWRLVEAALDRLGPEAGSGGTERLIELYLAGDTEGLLAEVRRGLPRDGALAARLERRLIDERNERMARRIAKRIAAEPRTSFFFAVGAGHLAGPRGIPQLLRREGLAIARATAAAAAP